MGINKKIIILLVILALAATAVFAFQKFRSSKQSGSQSAIPVDNAVDQVKQREFNDAIKKVAASDQDLDGLSDSDEAKYKTNPASSDTDEDGLTDYQEIFNFKTDPLKADTDGDSFADGYEVRRGKDPLVKGK